MAVRLAHQRCNGHLELGDVQSSGMMSSEGPCSSWTLLQCPRTTLLWNISPLNSCGSRYSNPRIFECNACKLKMYIMVLRCVGRLQGVTQDNMPTYNFPFTLQQLMVLKAYAVSQSPEEAAATLGMSKSNVSVTLKNLERTLGLELLHSQVAQNTCGC